MKPLDHLTDIRFTRDRDAARQAAEQLQRTPRRLRAAHAVRGAVSRPFARRGARRARADRHVRFACAGHQDGGSRGRPRWHRADERGIQRRRAARRASAACPISRDSCARRAGAACCCTHSIPVPSRRLHPATAATDADPASPRHRYCRPWPARRVERPLAPVRIWRPRSSACRRDLDSYYLLTFTSTSANDGRFHTLQVTSSRRNAQVRTRSGYWAPLPSELRTARLATPPLLPTRALRRSPFIDSWFGLTVQPDGQRRVIFTWTPAPRCRRGRRPAGRADVVALKVTTPDGHGPLRRRSCAGSSRECPEPAARQRSVPGDAGSAAVRSEPSCRPTAASSTTARRTSTFRTCAGRRR